MRRLFAFLILASIKTVTRLFFKEEYTWTPDRNQIDFDRARMIIFLNHTSLYEPVFLSALPYSFLWQIVAHLNLPIADVTLNRPIVGLFFKLMIPKVFSITRKADDSWTQYLNAIDKDDLVIVAPEGRMKRPNGLDKNGKKMSIRGGVADIVERVESGTILLCFSGGLHHIQKPGEFFPKLFKQVRMHVTEIEIQEYKKRFSTNPRERKMQIVQDLQEQLEKECPLLENPDCPLPV